MAAVMEKALREIECGLLVASSVVVARYALDEVKAIKSRMRPTATESGQPSAVPVSTQEGGR